MIIKQEYPVPSENCTGHPNKSIFNWVSIITNKLSFPLDFEPVAYKFSLLILP